ncbi:glycoside hydrolase [Rhizodiscina lignyota]|uniref:alpha-L-fucosidase n=1 Tax=Rhizodiscina lignyota TaxID=1504668 RepID=A0A9P4M9M0_9PEZI|nr:glycoside hydrolase [Rhizodiscina lignyota]
MASTALNSSYADGSSGSSAVLVPAFQSWPYPAGGDLVFPFFYTNETVNYNRSNIFQVINWLDSSKELTSLTLPDIPEHCSGPELDIQYARTTQKWIEGSNKTQIVEVLVNNVGEDFVLRSHDVTVTIDAPGLEVISPATIKRLRPGDQRKVQIGVRNKAGVAAGSTDTATIKVSGKGVQCNDYAFHATYGIVKYQANYESVYSHDVPDWYNNAKFGIFIHWGVYAVPGWGNVGKAEQYAEWYWWYLNQGPNDPVHTYQYHLKTYGPNVVYDDFIQNFTADAWDPKEWVDLFADAGANYFVQVSKHHDGYAIFDIPENVTKRTSVQLFPHRNLLQELFDASKKYQPHLHHATYFSLPEWFHPDYKKYGFGNWPGGNATNPFTNETLPYTGYVPVKEFVSELIVPEMQTLANMGTEIMWCDIGGPNLTAEWASGWFNQAADENRQVVMNARCGLPGDFDTPEYARYPGVQVRKWESNLGMDPFSYGFNRATPLASYMNASTLVTSLVDIVSKNGNFLLDVGPMANGTIIDVEQQHLRQAGTWIKDHAEAIFNTTYWFVTPQEGDNVRFTQTDDAFYILCMARPNGTLTLESEVPWVQGDQVTVVGGGKKGTVVPTKLNSNGSLTIDVSDEVADADKWTWVFKITY